MTTKSPVGRPQVYKEPPGPKQFSFRVEPSEAQALLSEKAEGETNNSFFRKSARFYCALRKKAKDGCQVAIAALALLAEMEAGAMELPYEPPSTVREVQEKIVRSAPRVSPVLENTDAPPEKKSPVDVSSDTAARVRLAMDASPASLSGRVSAAVGEPKPGTVVARKSGSQPMANAPIQFGDRLEAAQWRRIEAARQSIFDRFGLSELEKVDRGPKEAPHADPTAWPDYYEANLSKLTREYSDEPAPPRKAEPPPPSETPEEVEIARYKEELHQIGKVRVIANAVELSRLAKAEHFRRMADIRKRGPS